MRYFITGGAGFIGSHIADRLLAQGDQVVVYDNFSTGQELFVAHQLQNPNYTLVRNDVLNRDALLEAMDGCEMVFHFQANADVRGGITNTSIDLQQNTTGTYQVLECMRQLGIKKIAFASSATVYGEPTVFPTPEDYYSRQTSLYGASKAAAEDLIEAFCEYYGIQGYIFRFVSFVGPRYTHGVIFDFMKKLLATPGRLDILGNGQQRKSYLDVIDGVSAILLAVEKANDQVNIFNLGNKEYLTVNELAQIMTTHLDMKDVEFVYSGGERGWLGDSPFVHLDISRIRSLGWAPSFSIKEGVIRTVDFLKENSYLLTNR